MAKQKMHSHHDDDCMHDEKEMIDDESPHIHIKFNIVSTTTSASSSFWVQKYNGYTFSHNNGISVVHRLYFEYFLVKLGPLSQ